MNALPVRITAESKKRFRLALHLAIFCDFEGKMLLLAALQVFCPVYARIFTQEKRFYLSANPIP